MASQTGICNIAMRKLGAGRITNLADDPSEEAKVLRDLYDACLDAELAAHPWTFASARAAIPANAIAPAFGWKRSYPKPAGFLKTIEIGDDWCFYRADAQSFALEGNAILTDAGSPLRLRYIRRITNTGDLAPLFVMAFACRLAAESAESITQNLSKKEAAWNERRDAIRAAKLSNDIEIPPQRSPMSSWELANRGFGG